MSTNLLSFKKELVLTPITNLAENLKIEINEAYLVTILESKDSQYVHYWNHLKLFLCKLLCKVVGLM